MGGALTSDTLGSQFGGRLEAFASPSQQPLPSRAANPSPVAIDRVACGEVTVPVAASALRFGNVAPHLEFFEILHRPIAVVALSATTSWRPSPSANPQSGR